VSVFVMVLLLLPLSARAQDTLQRVRDLYAAAAYEDALSAVARIDADESDPAFEQYRVFCLVALGRTDEAQKAIEAVLTKHPLYRPDQGEASPRILELFADARRHVVPPIAQSMYTEARAAMDRKDRNAAVDGFEQLLRVVQDPDLAEDHTVAELRLLADGFLRLSKELPAPPDPPAATPESNDAAEPAAPVKPPVVVPPVAISEPLPSWNASGGPMVEYTGTIRLRISAEGKVTSVELVKSAFPTYDPVLLAAAKDWTYQPARRDGVAIASEKTLQVTLKPRE
jgi:hypothetical protein